MKTIPIQEESLRMQDRALDSIYKIETLIGLMEAATQTKDSEPLEAPLVASTVSLIRGETTTLRQILKDLGEKQANERKNRPSRKQVIP